VPINALVAVPGTPLEDQPAVDPFDLVRMCATARIVMPRSAARALILSSTSVTLRA